MIITDENGKIISINGGANEISNQFLIKVIHPGPVRSRPCHFRCYHRRAIYPLGDAMTKIIEKYPPLAGSPASFIFVSPDDRDAFNQLCENTGATSERLFSIMLARYVREMEVSTTVNIPIVGSLSDVCKHEHQVTDTKRGIYGPDDYRETVVCTDCGQELE